MNEELLVVDRINETTEKLQTLQQLFVTELPGRLAAIESQWQACLTGGDSGEWYRLVHSLAGAAGTFGFYELGDYALELEDLILQQRGTIRDCADLPLMQQAMSDLHGLALADAVPLIPVAAAEPESDDGYHVSRVFKVYLLEGDTRQAEVIGAQLQHFGYEVTTFRDSWTLMAALAGRLPDVLLIDMQLSDGVDGSTDIVTASTNVPVIFISGDDDWENRLAAVRAGGQSFFARPLNLGHVVDQLDAITDSRRQTPYRILVVDDTQLLARHYAMVLEASGMQARTLDDPTKLLEVLPNFNPDLLLMDIYMPACSGIEAAQVIRQHPAYANLPIVYLSTEKALDLQLEALRVGGDDFLQKPISDIHLVTALRIRAKRFRELRALMNQDGLTGLLNHINLKLVLERDLAQALRQSTPMCFVMLDIDEFKSINDRFGHPLGDRVIKSLARLLTQRVRKSDTAARYGGEEFALILHDTHPDAAREMLDELRRQFTAFVSQDTKGVIMPTFSAGIAACPPLNEMQLLIAAADEALYHAKNAGRDQVRIAQQTSQQKDDK